MNGRVIVVGSVNIDLVVSTARLPAPGETVVGGRLRQGRVAEESFSEASASGTAISLLIATA